MIEHSKIISKQINTDRVSDIKCLYGSTPQSVNINLFDVLLLQPLLEVKFNTPRDLTVLALLNTNLQC